MTNKFLFKVLMSYVPKNKMDEEIKKYFQSLDASLIGSRADLTSFRKTIRAKVKEIHATFPRCKNIPLEIYSYTGVDESCNCGATHGTIYNINRDYKPSSL